MKSSQPHRIFWIPEILEQVLLHTDVGTLLTSAQRVCRFWHDLTQSSRSLQTALFFQPLRDSPSSATGRVYNPFLENKIWPQLFCGGPSSHVRSLSKRIPVAALIDPEDAYVRQEASWRRMLIQQPPASSIGVFVMESRWIKHFGILPVRVNLGSDIIRIEDLYRGVLMDELLPLRDPMVFWDYSDYWMHKERIWQKEITIARSQSPAKYDLVIFTSTNWSLFHTFSGMGDE
ncbi:hypothetical protein BDV24DRAFT_156209 [Aspergillus arachidicola]|uniref:F-box domain-containing protein n=1 Tax=Aspergillus arachidicola TaxID=656916 RepID=A0A5N6XSS7_9EURO|nr:hypothetical protein BDV24DRAFT_156209 [Aspergillus arachidicola]